MANPIAAGSLLTAGLRTEFANLYDFHYSGIMQNFGDIFWLDVPSDKRKELYAFLNAAPYPSRWDQGTLIESANMLSVQFSVVNYDWGKRIVWHTNDRADDQTQTLFIRARELGAHWATLEERIIVGQMLPAATVNDLLPVVPNAADGSALYISTTRFGVSGGNIVTLTGSSTVQQIITDLISVKQRFYDFQDTEGQPLWDATEIAKGISVIYPSNLMLVFNQVESMMLVPLAASSATSNAGIQNLIQVQKVPMKFVPTQRLTATAYYSFLNGLPGYKRAIFTQNRQPFFETYATWETSDHTRDTGEEYIQFKSRKGYGIGLPYATVKTV